jgi:hypothetical protein
MPVILSLIARSSWLRKSCHRFDVALVDFLDIAGPGVVFQHFLLEVGEVFNDGLDLSQYLGPELVIGCRVRPPNHAEQRADDADANSDNPMRFHLTFALLLS